MLESGALDKALDVEAQPAPATPLPPPFEGPAQAKRFRCYAAVEFAFITSTFLYTLMFLYFLVRDFERFLFSSDVDWFTWGSGIAVFLYVLGMGVVFVLISLLMYKWLWANLKTWKKNREASLVAAKE